MKPVLTAVLLAAACTTSLAQAQAPASAPAAPGSIAPVEVAVRTPSVPSPSVPSPEASRAVRDLLDGMDYQNVARKMLDQMAGQMPQMMLEAATATINANKSLSEAQRKEALDKAANQLPQAIAASQELFTDPTLVDDILNQMVPLYASHFTVDELHQMAAFYRTPVGRKMMAEMPRLSVESMQIGQRVILPRIDRMMKRFAAKSGSVQPATTR